MAATADRNRCDWCLGHPLMMMMRYHDTEWGVPLHDDRKLYEFLVLDAAQAGLSWQTVLLKRENYRKAFDGFDPERIARCTEKRVARLLANPGIIRNRLKVESAITPPWRGAPFPQGAGRIRPVELTGAVCREFATAVRHASAKKKAIRLLDRMALSLRLSKLCSTTFEG